MELGSEHIHPQKVYRIYLVGLIREQQCGSNIDHNLNTHMIQYSHHLWASQTRQSIHEHRMELINHMEDVSARNLTQQYGSGRGIVMVAGNADTLKRVKWTLMMMRDYGCGLPVQIVRHVFSYRDREACIADAMQYHFPSEAPAHDDPIREELANLGAELVEAAGQERDEGKSKSYHIKAISITDSPWQEVIYLVSWQDQTLNRSLLITTGLGLDTACRPRNPL